MRHEDSQSLYIKNSNYVKQIGGYFDDSGLCGDAQLERGTFTSNNVFSVFSIKAEEVLFSMKAVKKEFSDLGADHPFRRTCSTTLSPQYTWLLPCNDISVLTL